MLHHLNAVQKSIRNTSLFFSLAVCPNTLTANVQPITDSNVVYFQDKEHLDGLVAKGAVLAKVDVFTTLNNGKQTTQYMLPS